MRQCNQDRVRGFILTLMIQNITSLIIHHQQQEISCSHHDISMKKRMKKMMLGGRILRREKVLIISQQTTQSSKIKMKTEMKRNKFWPKERKNYQKKRDS